ncbi:methyltransferase domain-containing protein [Motiliproteus coralliicola]|uniref:Ribosomal RNA large subunit methyltransferase G n=1 Tax=Motiliproteus coralliicola TaxID=2283196 RepID=A0A369WRH2_9GAMM|nr:methyltransferase [Motiliproteus coralliicola]RDE24267.1 methyltransferase domain-containing protein [Motiliproteus coralliicola]
MSADQLFKRPEGTYRLHRYPHQPRLPLRAWDAADELLLQHLDELRQQGLALPSPLILNDAFGALALGLHQLGPYSCGDSFLAQEAVGLNLKGNGIDPDQVHLLAPFDPPPTTVKLLLIKLPKTLSLLEDQLCRIRPYLAPDCRIIGAAMAKHIQRSTVQLFERLIGPSRCSLAKKKARLLFAELDPTKPIIDSPYPSSYRLEGSGHQVYNQAGVFSREKLDIGTRLFLQHIPSGVETGRIIDLGCGNGLVGLIAAERNPDAQLLFTDESFRALASAKQTFEATFGDQRPAEFIADNCLEQQPDNSAALVLNNPPFHQQQSVGDHIARQMFRDARRVLKQGGELRVIGNRHLGYHQQLRRLFGNCELVASNPKFVVLSAIKR